MNEKILAIIMYLREKFPANPEIKSLVHQLENLQVEISALEKQSSGGSNADLLKSDEKFRDLCLQISGFYYPYDKEINTDTILTDIYDILTDNF